MASFNANTPILKIIHSMVKDQIIIENYIFLIFRL